MSNYQAGYGGAILVGATDLNVTKWDYTARNGILDTTNTGTSGWETFIAGVSGGDLNISAHWDAAAQPFASPPNLVPGQIVTATLKVGTTSQKTFTVSIIIETAKITSDVKGTVDYDISAKTTGTVTLPT